jgi:hypothetical protein
MMMMWKRMATGVSELKKEVKEVVQASSSLFSEAAQMAFTATERITKTNEKK